CGSAFDTYLTVYDAALVPIFFSDDATGCSPQSEVTFSTAGQDTLYISVEGWNTETGDYTLNIYEQVLAIDEINIDLYHIYPNPAKDNIQIKGLTNGIITLFDQGGRIILQEQYTGKVDIKDYSPGVYYLAIDVDGDRFHKKVIIE
ncbi:MAG: T9SS type A sorting domain-containing protein, partial [Flavobacteriales bacterium]|nr:T9SS type A sorting domain-containing protein [Flavobacteriales bacterium]